MRTRYLVLDLLAELTRAQDEICSLELVELPRHLV